MENFKKNLKRALKALLAAVIFIICMWALIQLVAPAKGEDVDTIESLNVELESIKTEWEGINDRQRLYNEYSDQQKRLKEAEADFVRAKIEDLQYQKNVLEFGKGVEQVFQQGN